MWTLLGLIVSVVAASATSSVAADSLDIREWEVPYEQSRPRDPFAASDSSVWFVGQRTGYLALERIFDANERWEDLIETIGLVRRHYRPSQPAP